MGEELLGTSSCLSSEKVQTADVMRVHRDQMIATIQQLLQDGNGRFEKKDLNEALGNNDRRTRHAIYEARKRGIDLQGLRRGGHAVEEYVLRNGWKSREEYGL